jgi:hypothetical protein
MKTEHQHRAEPVPGSTAPSGPARMGLRRLIGAGDRIGLLALPFLIVGVPLNLA